MRHTNIAIIGGGAAGLMSAIAARRSNPALSVLILEKNPRVGKKLLLTGNGRCNLSHIDASAAKYHGEVRLCEDILSRWNLEKGTVGFFRELGLLCREDGEGRLYPRTNAAGSVLDVLRIECARLGAEEKCGFCLSAIGRTMSGYSLSSKDGETVTADRIIIAAGGASAPATGSDGAVMSLLKRSGVEIAPLYPSLSPLPSDPALLRPLKGLRVMAKASLVATGAALKSEEGEVQFGDGEISGICVFNLSRLLCGMPSPTGGFSLSLDLFPDASEAELSVILSDIAHCRADLTLESLLTGLCQSRIAAQIVKTSVKKPLSEKISTLTDSERQRLVRILKGWSFPVKPAVDFTRSQATAGGIVAAELSEELMLKKLPGVYAAGEIINVDGDCGGYNLEWAWASGHIAGQSAAKR